MSRYFLTEVIELAFLEVFVGVYFLRHFWLVKQLSSCDFCPSLISCFEQWGVFRMMNQSLGFFWVLTSVFAHDIINWSLAACMVSI